MEKKKLISIITPSYNEELNLEDCYNAVKKIFSESLPDYNYEHIFCDNNSQDNSPQILNELAGKDKRVKVILNARNYGPFRSTFNGLKYASGDAVVVMLVADMQDPPELIPDFVKKWEEGFDVVYGVRKKREESLILRSIRKLFYRSVSRFADFTIPLDAGEFQLIDKKVHQALLQFDDYYPYIRGMIASCGYKSTGVDYVWRKRKKGFSKNRLYHLIDQGLNGLISFTNVPMRILIFTGLIISILSILYAVAQFAYNLLEHGTYVPPGIPTLITAIFFFSGVQLFFLGFLGEYISAIHFQVRKRPLVTIDSTKNFDDN